MYDAVSGIEVYLRPYRKDDEDSEKQYPEYEAPRGSPLYTGDPRERYIEAVPGEQYQIVTILHPEFRFKARGCVKIEQIIDDSLRPYSYLRSKDRKPNKRMKDVTTKVRRVVDDPEQVVPLAFGSIPPREDFNVSAEVDAPSDKECGSIVIQLQRGSLEETKKKGMTYTSAKGKTGIIVDFTFYYTSRTHLEKNKILSKTIIPALEVSTNIASTPDRSTTERALLTCGAAIPCSGTTHTDDRDDEETFAAIKMEPTADASCLVEHTEYGQAEEATKEAYPFPASLTAGDRHKKRPIYIGLVDSDNKPPPPKKMETEPEEIERYAIQANMFPNTDIEASNSPRSKTSPVGQNKGPTVSGALKSTTKQSKNAKERSRLRLELDRINVMHRLQELDDEEDY